MFLMDIGNHSYTEFQYGPALVEAYDQNEELFAEGVRTALIHSHHNMPTYFSSTDKEELEDNTPDDVDMYLSLVVNNKLEWSCAITTRGIRKITTSTYKKMKKLGGKSYYKTNKTETVNEEVLYFINVVPYVDGLLPLAQRITAIEEDKKAEAEKKRLEALAKLAQQPQTPKLISGTTQQDRELGFGRENETFKRSKSTDESENPLLPKLLTLSEDYPGDFEEALNFIEEKFNNGFRARFLEHYRKNFVGLLDKLVKKSLLTGIIVEDDIANAKYTLIVELVDEIYAWKGTRFPLFKELTRFLEDLLTNYEEDFGEESIEAEVEAMFTKITKPDF